MNTHHKVHQTRRFWLNVQECLGIKLPPQDMRRLAQLRMAARLGEPLPIQLCHTLEVLGSDINYVNDVRDVNGVYGGSPAATIAMLNRDQGLILGEGEANLDSIKASDFNLEDTLPLFPLRENASQRSQVRSIAFLSEMTARLEGTLPTATIGTFERSWIFYNLIQTGVAIPADIARAAADYFTACLGSRGAGFAQGLPPDSDDSAVIFCVLSALGYPVDPVCLLTYEDETCFRCYDGERTSSVSTNAHILEAFGSYMERCSLSVLKYRAAMAKISTFLLSVQREDGSWSDKWHASLYYTTACCVLALRRFGVGDTVAALDRVIAWVLRTQREDGSWGFWRGTLEETAYALQIILLAGRVENAAATRQAALLGERFLIKHFDVPPSDSVHMPLWHSKELYEPVRIVRAAVLSALYLCATLQNAQPVFTESLVGCAV